MNTVISFTPAELLLWASALITIASAFGVIFNLASKIRAPINKQNDRITDCEKRLDKIEKAQSHDNERFAELDNGSKITVEALLALLKHSLNGNEVKALKDAEKNLEKYLINK